MATGALQTCRRVLTRGRELARRREPVGLPTEGHEMKQQAQHPPGGSPGGQQRAREQRYDHELVHAREYRPQTAAQADLSLGFSFVVRRSRFVLLAA